MLSYRLSFEQDYQISSDDGDFTEQFTSLDEVTHAIKKKGVCNCGLIFGRFRQ